MEQLVKIGNDGKTVARAKESILEILNAKADQDTIRHALTCFSKTLVVENINFDGCSIINNPSPTTKEKDPTVALKVDLNKKKEESNE